MAIKGGFIKPIIYRPQTKTLLFVRHSFFYKLTMLLSSCNTAYEVQTDGLHPAAYHLPQRSGSPGAVSTPACKSNFILAIDRDAPLWRPKVSHKYP